MVAVLLGRIVNELHGSDLNMKDADDNENTFWKTYSSIEDIILNTLIYLPGSSTEPASGSWDPARAQLQLSINTCVICLHQAAVFKFGKNPRFLPKAAESRLRCVVAAKDVAAVLRNTSNYRLQRVRSLSERAGDIRALTWVQQLGPFGVFGFYLAARVLALAIRDSGYQEDNDMQGDLQVLLTKLELLKSVAPYTESLVRQLNAEFERVSELNPIGHLTTIQSSFVTSPVRP